MCYQSVGASFSLIKNFENIVLFQGKCCELNKLNLSAFNYTLPYHFIQCFIFNLGFQDLMLEGHLCNCRPGFQALALLPA